MDCLKEISCGELEEIYIRESMFLKLDKIILHCRRHMKSRAYATHAMYIFLLSCVNILTDNSKRCRIKLLAKEIINWGYDNNIFRGKYLSYDGALIPQNMINKVFEKIE